MLLRGKETVRLKPRKHSQTHVHLRVHVCLTGGHVQVEEHRYDEGRRLTKRTINPPRVTSVFTEAGNTDCILNVTLRKTRK